MILVISGAADKIAYEMGVLTQLIDNGMSPRMVVATSAGGIAGLVYVTNNMKKGTELALGLSVFDIFGYEIYSLSGLIKGLKNIIKGELALWNYDELDKTIRKAVSIESFNTYRKSDKPPLFINVTGVEDAGEHFVNIKEMEYEEAITAIIAGASIPIATNPVYVDELLGFDGSATSYIAAAWAAEMAENDKIVQVHARPQNRKKRKPPQRGEGFRFFKWFFQILDIILWRVGVEDIKQGDIICQGKGIKQEKYFPPYELLDFWFTATPADNKMMFDLGLKTKPVKV